MTPLSLRTASQVEASWHRQELSIAFPTDEAQTWSDPQVVAFSPEPPFQYYPHIFEVEEGRLWITAGSMRFSLCEQDFVS